MTYHCFLLEKITFIRPIPGRKCNILGNPLFDVTKCYIIHNELMIQILVTLSQRDSVLLESGRKIFSTSTALIFELLFPWEPFFLFQPHGYKYKWSYNLKSACYIMVCNDANLNIILPRCLWHFITVIISPWLTSHCSITHINR